MPVLSNPSDKKFFPSIFLRIEFTRLKERKKTKKTKKNKENDHEFQGI